MKDKEKVYLCYHSLGFSFFSNIVSPPWQAAVVMYKGNEIKVASIEDASHQDIARRYNCGDPDQQFMNYDQYNTDNRDALDAFGDPNNYQNITIKLPWWRQAMIQQ